MAFRFWATVSKDGRHIREVVRADGRENAEILLTANYTPEYKAFFNIKPVKIVVDEEEEADTAED